MTRQLIEGFIWTCGSRVRRVEEAWQCAVGLVAEAEADGPHLEPFLRSGTNPSFSLLGRGLEVDISSFFGDLVVSCDVFVDAVL